MSISALGRLKNHKIPRLHPNFRMCMPLNRHQLKMYAFPVKTQCLFQMRTFTVNQNLSRFYAPLWQFYAPLSRFYATNSDFYSEIHELTQILLRISEKKIGGWRRCFQLQSSPNPQSLLSPCCPTLRLSWKYRIWVRPCWAPLSKNSFFWRLPSRSSQGPI